LAAVHILRLLCDAMALDRPSSGGSSLQHLGGARPPCMASAVEWRYQSLFIKEHFGNKQTDTDRHTNRQDTEQRQTMKTRPKCL